MYNNTKENVFVARFSACIAFKIQLSCKNCIFMYTIYVVETYTTSRIQNLELIK